MTSYSIVVTFFLILFPSALVEWNKLDSDIRNSPSYWTFNKIVLNFIRSHSNDVLNVSHPKALFFLIRLRVVLIHLRYHKFKHSFLDALNRTCVCGLDIKTWIHFFLHCSRFTYKKQNLLLKIERMVPDIFRKTNTSITSMILNPSFSADLKPIYSIYLLTKYYPRKRFESALFTETLFVT